MLCFTHCRADVWHECSPCTVSRQAAKAALPDAWLNTTSGCCFTLFNAQVSWGSHSEVEAMRLLLRAALANTLNERFVYLCETAIPIYPPTVVYHQLMKETKSRIDACAKSDPEV